MNEDALSYLDMSWRSAVLLCLICPILTTAVTLLCRRIEQRANTYLALFLIVFCLNIVPQVIGFAGFYQAFPWLTFAPFNNELWLGPLLLLHTLALTKHSMPRYLKWLMLPGAAQTVYYTVAFVSIDTYQEKWAYNDAFHSVYILPVESILTVCISFFCAWMSFVHIRRYKTELLDVQSDVEPYDVSWLGWMIALIGALVTLWAGFEIVHRFVEQLSYPDQYPFHLVFLLIILIMAQRALSSIRLPFPTPVKPSTLVNQEEAIIDELADKIVSGLANSHWFLNKQFSLSDMARALNSNETYVSKAINGRLNKNFNTLVNEARVEHAKTLLSNKPDYKLSDLMFDAGFSSKASFNRSFKTITGVTPSAFQQGVSIKN